jgi:hypothetical protein
VAVVRVWAIVRAIVVVSRGSVVPRRAVERVDGVVCTDPRDLCARKRASDRVAGGGVDGHDRAFVGPVVWVIRGRAEVVAIPTDWLVGSGPQSVVTYAVASS